MKLILKTTKGITLIALVITIIVLLILAGVSIATLAGPNGILTQASEASKNSEIAEAKEQGQLDVMAWKSDKLEKEQDATLTDILVKGILTGKDYVGTLGETSFTTKKNKYEIPYKDLYNPSEGTTGGETGGETNLPSTSETTPFFPDDNSSIVDNTTLDTGLVVKDKNNNEWVWIEVPKSITVNKTTDTDIEVALQTYAAVYRPEEYNPYGISIDIWYDGCGLTESEYNINKSKMLQSIKINGGFWIGRYEVGADTYVLENDNGERKPLIQQDKYPYNWVTCSQAQGLSKQLNPNGSKYTSSLMYGIQWDLICKYLEEKATELGSTNVERQNKIETDSTSWGNYIDSTFDIIRGKYSINYEQSYIDVIISYIKPIEESVLLTTGASERNKTLNIYDLAGNEFEWTLERDANLKYPSGFRGGNFYHGGYSGSCADRSGDFSSSSFKFMSFRPALY